MGAASHSAIAVGLGAGVEVEVIDESGVALLPAYSAMHRFPGRGRPALRLAVTRGRLPDLDGHAPLLDCGRWKVYARGREYLLAMFASASPAPYSIAIVDFEAGEGELFVAAAADEEAYPFFYPVDELIFSKLLADRGGFIVHGCGIDYRGQGLLFPGHSGAGKSTIAELFSAMPDAHVLSDDRVAIQVTDDGVVIGGTPWHGTSTYASQRTVPLAQVLFLAHGDRNRLQGMTAGRAAAQLLALSVIPGWDRRALQATLVAAERIAERVPMAELAFVPDASAIDYVTRTIGSAQPASGSTLERASEQQADRGRRVP